MKRRLTIAIMCVLVAALLTTAVWAGVAHFRRARDNEIHHRIDQISNDTIPAEEDYEANYLQSRVLPDSKPLVPYLYSEKELLNDLLPNCNLQSASNEEYAYASRLLGHYPTDNIRRMENGGNVHYYAVYMTDKGARLFVFFNRDGAAYGHPVYMLKCLEHSAFASLKEGDPASMVAEIDPAATASIERFPPLAEGMDAEKGNEDIDERYSEYGSYSRTSIHLLKDGLLEIRYEYARDGSYIIRAIHYSPEFEGINPVSEQLQLPDISDYSSDSDYEAALQSYNEQKSLLESLGYSYEVLSKDTIIDEVE